MSDGGLSLSNIRELPEDLEACHVRIVQLEDAVQREVERQWNLLDRMRQKNEEEYVAENRHKAMVKRLLGQMPREWVRKFIYDTDKDFTTIRRQLLHEDLDGYEGEY